MLALSGCASGARATASTGGWTPAPSSPVAESTLRAAHQVGAALLASAELPPGARPVASSHDPELAAPLSELGCALLDGHRFWRVPGTLDGVSDFLRSHPSRHLHLSGSGIGGGPAGPGNVEVSESIPESAAGAGSSLVYSVVPSGPDTVTMRVDAEVIVTQPTCPHFGGVRTSPARTSP